MAENSIVFSKKELRGSRLQCLMLTSGSPDQVARRLTGIVAAYAEVDGSRDYWMPRGFLEPDEAELCKDTRFLTEAACGRVLSWWLAHRTGARTPVWDIASTARIGGRDGLILVEAKAHDNELSGTGKTSPRADSEASEANDAHIRAAIEEANIGLGGSRRGWGLNADHCYQLSNRFAWAWKIAHLGIPVVLVYLGFLRVEEMVDQGLPFGSAAEWAEVVRDHAKGVVPNLAWERSLDVGGTPLTATIQAMDVEWRVGGSSPGNRTSV